MNCDMCGKDTRLFIAEIEGTRLQVCGDCARYGKIIREAKTQPRMIKKAMVQPEKEEIIQDIVPDYAKKIRKAREKLGLKQEEFAKRISEKTSRIHNLETGNDKPSIALAKKLEKAFGISLIEEYKGEELPKVVASKKDESFTLGDMIKLKKR